MGKKKKGKKGGQGKSNGAAGGGDRPEMFGAGNETLRRGQQSLYTTEKQRPEG